VDVLLMRESLAAGIIGESHMSAMLKKLAIALTLSLSLLPVGAAQAADSVRVGLAAVYPAYSIPNAAKELGFYKEKNLDVDITQFRGGPATQEALASGAIDISTIAPGAAALAIAKGVQEKIVALSVPPTPQGWYILVPVSSPIKSMAELNGKTVGVTQKGSLTDRAWCGSSNAGTEGQSGRCSDPLAGVQLQGDCRW
jgi:NitT/TauT family transport system substrate-binding protein